MRCQSEMLGDHKGAQPCCLKGWKGGLREKSDVIDSERASTVEPFLDEGFRGRFLIERKPRFVKRSAFRDSGFKREISDNNLCCLKTGGTNPEEREIRVS